MFEVSSINIGGDYSYSRYYSDRGICSKCYLSCMTCSGPRRDQCVSCPTGWQLAAGECHPECPEGFFKSEYGCDKCHHYCRTCKGIEAILGCIDFSLKTVHVTDGFQHMSTFPQKVKLLESKGFSGEFAPNTILRFQPGQIFFSTTLARVETRELYLEVNFLFKINALHN